MDSLTESHQADISYAELLEKKSLEARAAEEARQISIENEARLALEAAETERIKQEKAEIEANAPELTTPDPIDSESLH